MVTTAKKSSAKANGAQNGNSDKSYSPAEFVTAWKQAHLANETIDGLAARLGMKKSAISARASQYRKLKVNLPSLRRNGKGSKIDVNALNAILAN